MLLIPLNGLTPVLLLLQDGAILNGVSDALAVVVILVAAVVPRPLHGDASACDQLRVEKTRQVVDVRSVQSPACCSWWFVPSRNQ